MRATGYVLLLLASIATGPARACDGGRVFADLNHSGGLDAGEPGIVGVMISDGWRIVISQVDGSYVLPRVDGRRRFVIKPAGYAFPSGVEGLPEFYERGPSPNVAGPTAAATACHDFPLLPDATPRAALELLVFADPQPKTLLDVDYYARDIVTPILTQAGTRPAADLGLTLGDVVHDNPSLYPDINRVTAKLAVPWLHAAGNHDVDAAAGSDEQSLLSFAQAYGPDTFAWEETQATIVVLDDVIFRPGATPGYVGGLREDQFEFLQAYLAQADRSRLLVIAAHIPLFDPEPGIETFRKADRWRLFALLRDYPKVLLLSAHGHVQRHYFHDADDGWAGPEPLHEYNVGAACGAYWSGVRDAQGIPDTTMSDGTPNGYARVRIQRDGRYALRWFAARDPDNAGLALYAPRVLRRGAYPGFGVFANVFMGHAGSVVEYRVDGGDWSPMQRIAGSDPRVLAENIADADADALRGYDRLPEATPSTHLWRGTLPTDLALGEHRVEVRSSDPWRGELQATTRYQLVEPTSLPRPR